MKAMGPFKSMASSSLRRFWLMVRALLGCCAAVELMLLQMHWPTRNLLGCATLLTSVVPRASCCQMGSSALQCTAFVQQSCSRSCRCVSSSEIYRFLDSCSHLSPLVQAAVRWASQFGGALHLQLVEQRVISGALRPKAPVQRDAAVGPCGTLLDWTAVRFKGRHGSMSCCRA